MLEAAHNVLEFLDNKTIDDLQNDKILFFAVVKNIEIIGEAAFMLTKEFKLRNPDIPIGHLCSVKDTAGMAEAIEKYSRWRRTIMRICVTQPVSS